MTNGDATVLWRLDNLERQTTKLDDEKATGREVSELRLELERCRAAVNRNTRMTMALAFTIAGSAVAALLGIVVAFV